MQTGFEKNSKAIFALSGDIRYVALYRQDSLFLNQRGDLDNSSEAETDKYEEILVNPTLLKLVTQRGNIDCGGAEFILIGYGNFLQLVIALPDGHVSVAFERSADPVSFVKNIKQICQNAG